MEFEKTKCQGCGTQESPLYFLQPAQHSEDVWCEKCKIEEMKKRADAIQLKETKGHKGQNN